MRCERSIVILINNKNTDMNLLYVNVHWRSRLLFKGLGTFEFYRRSNSNTPILDETITHITDHSR